HKVAGSKLAAIDYSFNPLQRRSLIFSSDLVLRHFTVEILCDGFKAAVQKPLLDIAEHYIKSASRENMSNAIPHRPPANHTSFLNAHKSLANRCSVYENSRV